MKIILDNGHGHDTSGKQSPSWSHGEKLFEYEFNRDVVQQINELLTAEQYETEILVPELNDIPIKERVDRANEIFAAEECFLVSVHGNAAPNMNNGPHGIETFHYSLAGGKLAQYFQDELVSQLGWKDRGVRRAYQKIKINQGTAQEKTITIYKIAILKYTDMVAVLTENGFYTNFDQCQLMMTPEIRSQIAVAHVSAIKQYLFNLNS
jgi:N-acetylmuramoyl-L-alanine amidase